MALPIVWTTPKDIGQRLRGDKTYRAVVTETPKGVRFNATFSQKLERQKVKRLAVGFVDEQELIVVKPVYSDDGYSVIGNKHARQISAASIYHWMVERGLSDKIGKRMVGEWDEDEGCYVFDVNSAE